MPFSELKLISLLIKVVRSRTRQLNDFQRFFFILFFGFFSRVTRK